MTTTEQHAFDVGVQFATIAERARIRMAIAQLVVSNDLPIETYHAIQRVIDQAGDS